jgi:hypothetical protein
MMSDEILNYIKEQNDQDHKEIKDDLQWIRRTIAPHVIANKRAVAFILAIMSAFGFWKAFAG